MLATQLATAALAGVLLGETLRGVISVPQAHSEVLSLGALAPAAPATGGRGLRQLQPPPGGAGLLLLGAAWSRPMLP